MKESSYSQFGEDIQILDFYHRKNFGYYVEIGANDGISNSNTALLEENGWKGLLVEANPDLISACRQSRPNSIVVNYAVVAPENRGNINFYKVIGGPSNLNGLSTTVVSEEFISRICEYGGKVENISVNTNTLDDIFINNNVPFGFEFLSIDIEGGELEALKGFSIERFKPRIIVVEDNSFGVDTSVKNYLQQYGYVRVHRTGVNDWYVTSQDAGFFKVKRIILLLRLIKWWFMRQVFSKKA